MSIDSRMLQSWWMALVEQFDLHLPELQHHYHIGVGCGWACTIMVR